MVGSLSIIPLLDLPTFPSILFTLLARGYAGALVVFLRRLITYSLFPTYSTPYLLAHLYPLSAPLHSIMVAADNTTADTLRQIDDTSPMVVYKKYNGAMPWYVTDDVHEYGNSSHTTKTIGASANFTFVGKGNCSGCVTPAPLTEYVGSHQDHMLLCMSRWMVVEETRAISSMTKNL